MSAIMMALLRNNGFSCYVRSHFLSQSNVNGK
jgi:hypothetical protein